MNETSLLRLMESALREECTQYEQLFDLSHQQFILLKEEDPDTDAIADLMNRKIELVKNIEEMDIRQESVRKRWACECERHTPEERAEIAQLRDKNVSLIERLHQMENAIIQAIKRCEREINRRLKNLQKGRMVNQAYFTYERVPSRYIDKKK